MAYSDIFKTIKEEYDSVVRQTRVKNHLSNLCISNYVTFKDDTAAASALLNKQILTTFRQVPPSLWDDAHKIEFPRSAEIGDECATKPPSGAATSNSSC